MIIDLRPGTYVVAVSGGVDSVALLHLLHNHCRTSTDKPWKLVVAHFDHGMRSDSSTDRRLVQKMAREYKLPFIYDQTNLGEGASEDIARTARYKFLHEVRLSSGAGAVVTAHHQDDALETAMLNLLRGTGRRGMTSLKSTDIIKRPLLHLTKQDLKNYALKNNLSWREDSTNTDPRYLRNHLRHNLLPDFAAADRNKFLNIVHQLHELNLEIDNELKLLRQSLTVGVAGSQACINRAQFTMLPHAIAREVMLDWLRSFQVMDVTRPMLEKLVIASKTLMPGKQVTIDKHTSLHIRKTTLAIIKIPEKA